MGQRIEGTGDQRVVRLPPLGNEGFLGVPDGARGVVLFAHGSGSGRLSPRNNAVAAALRRGGLATLLFDLLSEEESLDRANVFDIGLLGSRLQAAARWASEDEHTQGLPIGLFGSSTGAAAALVAASSPDLEVAAVVSRGGRPDLAGLALPLVRAPTLLIVGSRDHEVLELNREALARLTCRKELAVVPGATHLFEEPGTLERVTELAEAWFRRFLGEAGQRGLDRHTPA